MKKVTLLLVVLCCATITFAKKPKKVETTKPVATAVASSSTPKPQTLTEITSYALGANMADGLKKNADQFGITIDWNWIKQGITDLVNGHNQFDENQMRDAFAKLDSLVSEYNKVKSQDQKDFLVKNKAEKGVITTESGLQYKINTLGKGPKPTITDQVKVNYEGRTIDGKVFDSSYQRGEPATFGILQVIKGWQEGLLLMPVGSKFTFYIPSELAYGEQGAGNMIAPNSTLIFDVELLEIVPIAENTNMIQPVAK